jgi:predicted P-loop ATPase
MQANQNVETTVRVLIGTLPANIRTRLVRDLATEMAPAQQDTHRIMRRAEAGKVLGRSTRAIDLLAKQGHLEKVRFPGRTRAGGFLAADVYALLACKRGDAQG